MSMSRTIVFSLPWALWLAHQHPSPTADSVRAEISKLIEKTNRLESFHLVYTGKVTDQDGESRMDIVLAYEAPDRSYLCMSGPRGEFENWYLGGRMYLHSMALGWQRAAFPEVPPAYLRVLDASFPPPPTPLSPGTRFDLLPGTSRSGVIRIRSSHLPFGRQHLFSWLDWLRSRASTIVVDERALTTEGPHFRMSFDRTSGLLTRYRYASAGQSAELDLELAETEVPPELLELPEEAHEAERSLSIQKRIDHLYSHDYVRTGGFARVGVALLRGRLEWNEGTRTSWIEFLEPLHRPRIAKATRSSRDTLLEELRSFEGRSPEDRARLRTSLQADLERTLKTYLEGLPEVPSPEPFPPALEATEREVVRSIVQETLHAPLLRELERVLRSR